MWWSMFVVKLQLIQIRNYSKLYIHPVCEQLTWLLILTMGKLSSVVCVCDHFCICDAYIGGIIHLLGGLRGKCVHPLLTPPSPHTTDLIRSFLQVEPCMHCFLEPLGRLLFFFSVVIISFIFLSSRGPLRKGWVDWTNRCGNSQISGKKADRPMQWKSALRAIRCHCDPSQNTPWSLL